MVQLMFLAKHINCSDGAGLKPLGVWRSLLTEKPKKLPGEVSDVPDKKETQRSE